MKRSFAIAAACISAIAATAQLEQNRYSADPHGLPDWVQLMYAPDADPGAVQAAYTAYYATHPFVKNSHTQYFKRWKRELGHALV
ncbi:MAG TPA: hypothetical protein P5291_12360, partial [Flavobacteriales bacterium]|nr:hypothetical protein [Flavobacteriales bacterium]